MLAYLLGLFVPWRILAVLGKTLRPFLLSVSSKHLHDLYSFYLQVHCLAQYSYQASFSSLNLLAGWYALTIECLFISVHIMVNPLFFFVNMQAKMGMTDDFETSLQVLRGFETDITVEVNEIKVILLHIYTENVLCFKRYHADGCLNTSLCKCVEICGIIYKAIIYSSVCRSQAQEILFPSQGAQIFPLINTFYTIGSIYLKLQFYFVVCAKLVGIGLHVLQQLGGINGVLFYSSTIFESAGRTLP